MSAWPAIGRQGAVSLTSKRKAFSQILPSFPLTIFRYDTYVARGVYVYWGAATALSCVVMSAGLVYIVNEYCTQSHMSTEDYGRAMQGLRMTRWFRKHTRFIRFIPNHLLQFGKWIGWKLSGGTTRPTRRSLIWTANTYDHAGIYGSGTA